MNFSRGNETLLLLFLFGLVGLYECSYYRYGRRCLYGDCTEPANNLYQRVPENWHLYNRIVIKPTYSKPAYFKPSYVQPYHLNYPSWSRTRYQHLRPETPYEVVEVDHPKPHSLVYYPVVNEQTSAPYEVYNGIDTPSTILDALNGEREGPVIVSRPKPIYEEPGNEVVEVYEKENVPQSGGGSPPSCRKHEECTKFCQKTINSVGVFGSCYNGSCRCGIRN